MTDTKKKRRIPFAGRQHVKSLKAAWKTISKDLEELQLRVVRAMRKP